MPDLAKRAVISGEWFWGLAARGGGEVVVKALSWSPCAWSGFSLEREGSFWHRHGVSSWFLL